MKRKWEKGELENDEEVKKMYEYLVQIDFIHGTEEVLQNPEIARYESGDQVSKRAFQSSGVRARGKGERGIIVLKLEPRAERGRRESVLNYGITPKKWDADDPLQITNSRIARIKVIAKIVED